MQRNTAVASVVLFAGVLADLATPIAGFRVFAVGLVTAASISYVCGTQVPVSGCNHFMALMCIPKQTSVSMVTAYVFRKEWSVLQPSLGIFPI